MLSAEVLGRALGWGAYGTGDPHSQRVALTFDDGPSEHTGAILDALERHGAKGTFFVTQASCRAFPAQLQRIRQAGHQLEAHGRWHTHALLLWPWREWQQISWHPRALEPGPHLYRPPYGGHSPFTRLLAALARRRVTLWDVEGRDWTDASAEQLAAQTLSEVQGGRIVLLHDQFAVTPALLEHLLSAKPSQAFQFVILNDLPPRRIRLRAGLKRLLRSYGGPSYGGQT